MTRSIPAPASPLRRVPRRHTAVRPKEGAMSSRSWRMVLAVALGWAVIGGGAGPVQAQKEPRRHWS